MTATRSAFRLGACLLLAVLAGGCAKRATTVERDTRAGVLHFSIGAEPSDLDPQTVTGTGDAKIIQSLFEPLVSYEPGTLAPVPGLAERWEISGDGLTYTFHLRADARWSNGDPLTAQDVVDSWRRILTPALGAEYAYFLYLLRGAENFHKGGTTDFATVGVRAPDARTLVATLAHPAPYFLQVLLNSPWRPVHLRSIAAVGDPYRRGTKWTLPGALVSSGPFVLKEWILNRRVVVEKSPTYWDRARVGMNAIHFYPIEQIDTEERAFRAGQLHITEALPVSKVDHYRREQPGVLHVSPFLDTYFYRLNTTRPGLDHKLVRQALAAAIDRRSIVDKIVRGGQQPAAAFTPPGMGGYVPPDRLGFDPDRARRLLAEAGYPEGRGLPPIEILINSSGNHRIIAEVVQQMWRSLGVSVQIDNMEQSSLFAKRRTLDYSVLRSEWAADFADPKSFLDIFRGGSSNNHTGWHSAAYDELLQAADHTADPAARAALMQQAEALLLDEMPVIPLYYFTTVRLVHPAVRGWNNLPLDRHPYKHVWLEN